MQSKLFIQFMRVCPLLVTVFVSWWMGANSGTQTNVILCVSAPKTAVMLNPFTRTIPTPMPVRMKEMARFVCLIQGWKWPKHTRGQCVHERLHCDGSEDALHFALQEHIRSRQLIWCVMGFSPLPYWAHYAYPTLSARTHRFQQNRHDNNCQNTPNFLCAITATRTFRQDIGVVGRGWKVLSTLHVLINPMLMNGDASRLLSKVSETDQC